MAPIHLTRQTSCPQCSSHSVRQSRRRGVVERIVCAVLQVLPYRCNDCDHRYFRLRPGGHRVRRHRHA
jgi:hypothetical protein